MTELLLPSDDGIARAAAILRDGGLVGLPTETVYGLGGDATNDRAVASIYEAKGRPSFNPLIVHLADLDLAARFVNLTPVARDLAAAFWPGPLTMVLPLRPDAGISPLVTAGLPTLAVRVPAHPVARSLLAAFGGGIAAPSANPSGRISPTTAAHVMAGLDGRLAAVLDGGDCSVGVESTIIGFDGDRGVILRDGGVPAEALADVLGYLPQPRGDADKITAPGQLASHYAPQGRVRLNVTSPEPGEVFLGFGAMVCDLNLSERGDLAEAAANLFRHFHTLDAMGADRIAVTPVPTTGLGAAINDRLTRAAAPR